MAFFTKYNLINYDYTSIHILIVRILRQAQDERKKKMNKKDIKIILSNPVRPEPVEGYELILSYNFAQKSILIEHILNKTALSLSRILF
jgi:hypothetical protein